MRHNEATADLVLEGFQRGLTLLLLQDSFLGHVMQGRDLLLKLVIQFHKLVVLYLKILQVQRACTSRECNGGFP